MIRFFLIAALMVTADQTALSEIKLNTVQAFNHCVALEVTASGLEGYEADEYEVSDYCKVQVEREEITR